MTAEDRSLLDGFLAGTLGRFGHAEHVRLAWLLLGEHSFSEAHARMSDGLRRFAAAAGVPEKFDAALTRAWMVRVHERRRALPPGHDWATFAATALDLLRAA